MDFDDDDLAEDGAEFAAGGGEAVKGAAVAGWESFGWNLEGFFSRLGLYLRVAATHDESGAVWACIRILELNRSFVTKQWRDSPRL